jgi:PilZ domain-containing protein
MRERRQVPRYIYGTQGKVGETATGPAVTVTVEVLGTRGCAIKGGPVPPLGQACEVLLDWHGREIRLPATVAWKSKDERAGLKFGDIPEDQLKPLRGLCGSLQLQPLVPTPQEPPTEH